ncbi:MULTISPECIES: DUF948 domain-containing protein [unclassified Paenibacillus]|uniref:DUF948 domain-containing protein n=1 Tax=unclassified Paenibacillus TaxID=185978 RepID=UPI0003E23E4D|nr:MULTISPECIES: DUF948 domain-containing protein [unclassified Paenibacillus]ETT55146.1 hypothetical protein C162_03582 [Paenibacillus sp. FSL R7-269]OMF98137.1 hypothetical protein BK147_10970 [Paenibacillus sp. FSL R7-0337]
MVIQLSVALAAVAFVCLVAFVILTLRKGMTTLGETNKTLGEVRNAIHGLTGEATQLIHTANQVTRDVKGKIKTIDPIFESAHNVGEVIQTVTETFKKNATDIGQNLSQEPEKPAVKSKSGQIRVNTKFQ